jgi:hypothetical protein
MSETHTDAIRQIRNEFDSMIDCLQKALKAQCSLLLEQTQQQLVQIAKINADSATPIDLPIVVVPERDSEFQVAVRVTVDAAVHDSGYCSDNECEDKIESFVMLVPAPPEWSLKAKEKIEIWRQYPTVALTITEFADLMNDPTTLALVTEYAEKTYIDTGGSGYCRPSLTNRQHELRVISIVPITINQTQ